MAGVGPAGLFVLVLALVAKALYDNFYSLLPLNIGGHVDPQFKEVQEAFKQNFVDGWEKDGASLAVYRNGKKVVDLWGGYADRAATRKWSENTIQIAFSSTKGVAALTVALLVDRGRLEYDDLVTKFWPDFGKNGKANVTVQMIMSHMSGLAYFDEEVTEEQGTSHEKMRVLLENESPKWPPGTETGYHAVTYGWLVDQIVRHVDEKHRSVGAFFREEIAEPNGIDFYIGLPTSEEWRVARLSANTFLDSLSEVATDYRAIKYFLLMKKFFSDTHMKRVFTNTPWIMSFNDVDLHRIEQAAAFGIGNARSIARLFDLLVTGKLVSKKTSDQLQKWHVNKTDVVIDEHVAKGNGFFYFPLNRGGNQFSFGHPGHGCQNIVVDTKNKLTIAYTTSHLKLAQGGLCRTYARLQNAIYNVIEKE